MSRSILLSYGLCSLLLACGNSEPPKPLETIEVAQTKQFSVAGVEFTVNHFTQNTATIFAHNGNDSPVKILVEGVNTTGTPMSINFLLSGKDHEVRASINPSGIYKFQVWIWKDDIDILTCGFTSESCFRDSDELSIQF